MPAYPWLAKAKLEPEVVLSRMRALKRLGDPYTEQEIAEAPQALADKTELDALVAYLQNMGTSIKTKR
jgi:cytochrome c oxidase cbb3-type subunit 2